MFRKIRNLEKQMLDVQKDIEALKKENEAVKLELFEVKNPARFKCGDWVMAHGACEALVFSSKVVSVPFGFGCSELKRCYTVAGYDNLKIIDVWEDDILDIDVKPPVGVAVSEIVSKPTKRKVGRPKGVKAPKKIANPKILSKEQYAKFPMTILDYAVMMGMTTQGVGYRIKQNKLPKGISARKISPKKVILEYNK